MNDKHVKVIFKADFYNNSSLIPDLSLFFAEIVWIEI